MRRSHSSVVLLLAAALALGGAVPAPAAGLQEGDLDTGFGGDGVVTTSITPSGGGDYAHQVAALPDGRVLVAGQAGPGGVGFDFTLARYKAGGGLDTTFGDGGIAITDLGTTNDTAAALAVQADGKALVAGYILPNAGHYEFAVVRYLTSGIPDPDFGDNGVVITDWGSGASAFAVATDAFGRVVLGGYVETAPATYAFAVARYTSGGDPDNSFGDAGKVTLAPMGTDDEIFSAKVQSDGKIVVGGYSDDGSASSFALCRLETDGDPDPTFGDGSDGCVTDGPGSDDGIYSLALSNGKVVAAGWSDQGAGVARYTSAGVLDDTFGGGDGTVGDTELDISAATGVARQRDGKIVLSAAKPGTPSAISATRLTTGGAVDTGFGTGGVAARTIGSTNAYAEGLAVARDGGIVVVGYGDPGSGGGQDFAVVKFVGDANPPTHARLTGVPRWSTRLTQQFGLTAQDGNTGVRLFDIRRKVAAATSGAYGAAKVVASKTPATIVKFTAQPGGTYCLQTRARDWAGNIGDYGRWACVALPVDDGELDKTGSWTGLTGKAFYAGTARRSTDRGATLSLAGADYRHLALVATKCPGCGTVKVFRGSTLLDKVRLDAGQTRNRVVIPIDGATTVRSGTIRIKVVSGGKPVVIEGLGVSLA